MRNEIEFISKKRDICGILLNLLKSLKVSRCNLVTFLARSTLLENNYIYFR